MREKKKKLLFVKVRDFEDIQYKKVIMLESQTSQEETPGSSVAGSDWLPPLPNATPILTSGTDRNEYKIDLPFKTGIRRSCKMQYTG